MKNYSILILTLLISTSAFAGRMEEMYRNSGVSVLAKLEPAHINLNASAPVINEKPKAAAIASDKPEYATASSSGLLLTHF